MQMFVADFLDSLLQLPEESIPTRGIFSNETQFINLDSNPAKNLTQ
jgi:hypothetical protein